MDSEFLKNQNLLLERMNELLQTQNKILQQSQRKIFVENIEQDEIRDGFLVTSHRKKLWNVQIDLINEFSRVCKKYNLRWFAVAGTLLGAARHKGYIPWDDDVDIGLLRPDYEKFRQVAPHEFQYPYFFDAWYNYRTGDCDTSAADEQIYPLISFEECKKIPAGQPRFPMIKIRNSSTAMIELPSRKNVNQGIWIDIFPIDPVPPFTDDKQNINFEIARVLLAGIQYPEQIEKMIENGQSVVIPPEQMKNFLNFTHRKKVLFYENFLLENFSSSEYVSDFLTHSIDKNFKSLESSIFDDVIYLPFEKIQVPAPMKYEKYLTQKYGDWRTPIFTHNHVHEMFYSADIPYEEFFKTSRLV